MHYAFLNYNLYIYHTQISADFYMSEMARSSLYTFFFAFYCMDPEVYIFLYLHNIMHHFVSHSYKGLNIIMTTVGKLIIDMPGNDM